MTRETTPGEKMIEIGLWARTEEGETFLIKKDPNGYPDLSSPDRPLPDVQAKKEKARALYHALTGRNYPHPHATTRQVLWDFLEAAIERLP
ncbi:MAG TPA: hypothetical protein VIK48_01350 [Candidatus Manganitrophaceae bacterium]|nr:hypothetical protein [Candidatus Manganitrophaceae bacterium]